MIRHANWRNVDKFDR